MTSPETVAGAEPKAERWKSLATSLIGLSHERQSKGCQDHSAVLEINPSLVVLLAADGAGSAEYGGEGSKCVIQTVRETLRSRLGEEDFNEMDVPELLLRVFAEAHGALEVVAKAADRTLRQYATTLAIAICTPVVVYSAQVGDSVVCLLDKSMCIKPILLPRRSEHVNEVTFLTSEFWKESYEFESFDGEWLMVALQTDGLQWVTLNRGQLFEPFYQAVHKLVLTADTSDQAVQELSDQLMTPQVREKCDDDLTLVVTVKGITVCEAPH